MRKTSANTKQVHSTEDEETKGLIEFYPPHPPRKDTPEYKATHRLLINTLDTPCRDCGVRKSTLQDPKQNLYNSKQMETHHYPIQREFVDAVDPEKVHKEFKQVTDRKTLIKFIDSPYNMLVLCDVCHRSKTRGIHHINSALEEIKRFLIDGYVVDDLPQNESKDEEIDKKLTSNIPINEQA